MLQAVMPFSLTVCIFHNPFFIVIKMPGRIISGNNSKFAHQKLMAEGIIHVLFFQGYGHIITQQSCDATSCFICNPLAKRLT